MNIYLQHIVPHHTLTWIAKRLANCRWRFWKNWAIKRYIRDHNIDLSAALLENIEDYPDFNSFFTRRLKPDLRPIVQGKNEIACPVDGCISQIGTIKEDILFQAKGFYYSLNSLFGGQIEYADPFHNGKFATLYLSPKDYHRVHTPITGRLRATIYIPGRLFSVNQQAVRGIPNVFTRNERLICIFDTELGSMAVIFVGAMLVGGIQTVWPMNAFSRKIATQTYSDITLERGAELGRFNIGSTVILLFEKNVMNWANTLQEETQIKMGQLLATTKNIL